MGFDITRFAVGAILLTASTASASSRKDYKEQLNQLELARLRQQDQRKMEFTILGEDTDFKFNFAEDGNVIDNDAVLQLQVDKSVNPFLSTLATPGIAQFLTVLKPCGILLPHVHPRANELYTVLFGTMNSGISQENGAEQGIVFDTNAGEVMTVPQGLLHFNHNRECTPLVFTQTFSSSDPGALNVIGALAALGASGDAGAEAIKASGADSVPPLGAFALDKQCLRRCGFDEATGAPNDGLDDLPEAFRAPFGLDDDGKWKGGDGNPAGDGGGDWAY